MNSNKKNIAKEPSEVYQTIPDVNAQEFHPVLVKLLEKSIQEANEGKLIPHDEVMKRAKEKFPFLK
ncbi:MAG: hypothetical protein IPO23_04935 [Flavobacterium sp.]|nr:hypothetical protein [Flavobacterium sp.]